MKVKSKLVKLEIMESRSSKKLKENEVKALKKLVGGRKIHFNRKNISKAGKAAEVIATLK